MKDVKTIVSENLVKLRKRKGLTQSELAEQFNYTDKSVSKWEHGDAMPPVDVLKDLADFYNVSLDYLVSESSDECFDKKFNTKGNTTNKIVITLLAVSIIWFIATFVFLTGTFNNKTRMWLTFIYAIPLSSVVLIVFNSIWGKRKNIFYIISILIWSTLLAIFLTYKEMYFWPIFFLGIPMQISTILWSKLKPSNTGKKR